MPSSLQPFTLTRHPRLAQNALVTYLHFGEVPTFSLPDRAVRVFDAIDQHVFLESGFVCQGVDTNDVARSGETETFELFVLIGAYVHAAQKLSPGEGLRVFSFIELIFPEDDLNDLFRAVLYFNAIRETLAWLRLRCACRLHVFLHRFTAPVECVLVGISRAAWLVYSRVAGERLVLWYHLADGNGDLRLRGFRTLPRARPLVARDSHRRRFVGGWSLRLHERRENKENQEQQKDLHLCLR